MCAEAAVESTEGVPSRFTKVVEFVFAIIEHQYLGLQWKHKKRRKKRQIWSSSQLNVNVIWLWKETRVPDDNPHRNSECMGIT